VLNKVPLNDVLVIIAVTVITVFTDLATAVLWDHHRGALNFAWQQARELYADAHLKPMASFTACMARCSSPRPRRFSTSSIRPTTRPW
jgi:SulP family sulfate permease